MFYIKKLKRVYTYMEIFGRGILRAERSFLYASLMYYKDRKYIRGFYETYKEARSDMIYTRALPMDDSQIKTLIDTISLWEKDWPKVKEILYEN